MQIVVNDMVVWAQRNIMDINGKKIKDTWTTCKKSCPIPLPLCVAGAEIERVKSFKLLGSYLQNNLKWNTHVSNSVAKAWKRLYQLRTCQKANLAGVQTMACS